MMSNVTSALPINRHDGRLEFIWLLLLGFLWGIPYALTKISLTTIPPLTLVSARVSLAAVTLWVIAFSLRRRVPRDWNFVGRLFLQSCVACILPYTLIAFGQQSVSSALAAILNSSTPLFVCLISIISAHHERMSTGRITGMAFGMAGVVAIAGVSALAGIGAEFTGQAAILAATLASAISVIHGRRFTDIAPEVAAAGMLTWAAVVLVPLCLFVDHPWRTSPSGTAVAALLVNAIVATAFGFVVYFRLIRTIGSMSTASVGYLKPAMGVLIGCTVLGESLTWVVALGLGAILFGVATINGNMALPKVLRFARSGLRWP